MHLENLQHFSKLRDHVQFNMIWDRQYAIISGLTQCGIRDLFSLILCWRLVESDAVTPSVRRVD